MITEVALLNVKKGLETAFEKDFQTAGQYISSIDGYLGHSLKKCIETPNQYILIAQWRSVADHEIGFRQSAQYLKWKALLHHYYEPFPSVAHYEDIL